MKTNWNNYWNTFPKTVQPHEHFKQVGKTVNGIPISKYQFELIIESIKDGINLQTTDTVLDLCCGNGLITSELANLLSAIIGIDYSETLINIANTYHRTENIDYRQMSALDALKVDNPILPPFNKIYMYEALQHFRYRDLRSILLNILTVSSEDVIIFIGSIPDKKRLWNFYNTPSRKFDYFLRKIIGKDAIGTWWTKEYIESVCDQIGLRSECILQKEVLYTSHYRFNYRITRV